jgi:hypothetical protein
MIFVRMCSVYVACRGHLARKRATLRDKFGLEERCLFCCANRVCRGMYTSVQSTVRGVA